MLFFWFRSPKRLKYFCTCLWKVAYMSNTSARCPMDIWMSTGHFCSSIGRMDIWMSTGHFCLPNGRMDIWMSNGHFCSSIGRMDIWMSNGHFCSSNGRMDICLCHGHYWYLTPSMIMLVMPFVYWKLLWINSRWGTHAEMWLHVMLALDMSIRPLDDWTFKCPMDISICPFVHWTSGHIQMSDGHLDMSICPLHE